jgi:hypothetical protein
MPVQEADELDPFRGSVISEEEEEEAPLESQGRTQTHMRDGSGGGGGGGQKKKKEVYIYPSAAGGDVGHRRLGSAGTSGAGTRVGGERGGGGDRMMTSAEMNMKSQFLMNLRPFGEESARSEGSGTTTASGIGRSRLEVDKEGMLSEDEDERAGDEEEEEEEEQLGPGSDFFR